jgi:hypothetical protein
MQNVSYLCGVSVGKKIISAEGVHRPCSTRRVAHCIPVQHCYMGLL